MRVLKGAQDADTSQPGGCLAKIRSYYPELNAAEQRVADAILARPGDVVSLSVSQLAEIAGTADSTVVRFCQTLGYKGYYDLKINLARDLVTPLADIHEDVDLKDDVATIASKVISSDIQALKDTLQILDATELERAVSALLSARKVEFYGVGSSGPMAVDAYYRFLRIGIPAFVATDSHIQSVSASMLDKDSLAVGISHTGSTIETVQALERAKRAGAGTVCITSFAKSPITRFADIKLITAARETKFRSEAMASRIAQLTVIDVLYVGTATRRFDAAMRSLRVSHEVLAAKRF